MSGALNAIHANAGYKVVLNPRTISGTSAAPTDAEAGFRLGTDGLIYERTTIGGAYAQIAVNEWLVPANATQADLYECQATVTSGTLTTGTAGSWLPLSSDQSWTKTQTVIGAASCTFTLDIRLVGTSTNLASVSITLSAEEA